MPNPHPSDGRRVTGGATLGQIARNRTITATNVRKSLAGRDILRPGPEVAEGTRIVTLLSFIHGRYPSFTRSYQSTGLTMGRPVNSARDLPGATLRCLRRINAKSRPSSEITRILDELSKMVPRSKLLAELLAIE